MKLLLCKNVQKLGIVGDVVEVAPGYARNYLLPQRLATEPTEANMKQLAEARRVAEDERAKHFEGLRELAERLEGVEVTISAKANESGVLYGSVGSKEISAALQEEGYPVPPEYVSLGHAIRNLDTVEVPLKLADDIRTSVKVWVVRERDPDDHAHDDEAPTAEAAEAEKVAAGAEAGSTEAGTEAGDGEAGSDNAE